MACVCLFVRHRINHTKSDWIGRKINVYTQGGPQILLRELSLQKEGFVNVPH
jgi:hypothetical protein